MVYKISSMTTKTDDKSYPTEKKFGVNPIIFSKMSTIEVKDGNEIKSTQQKLIELSNFSLFYKFCHEEIESCKRNYAKDKIDRFMMLFGNLRKKVKRDYVQKITYLMINHRVEEIDGVVSDNFSDLLKVANRKWSNISRPITVEFLRSVFNELPEDRKNEIIDEQRNPSDDSYLNLFWDVYDELITKKYKIKKTEYNKVYYAKYSVKRAQEKIEKEYKNAKFNMSVTVNIKNVNKALKNREKYKKLINKAVLGKMSWPGTVVQKFNKLKEFFDMYYRKSARLGTYDFLLLSPDPITLIDYFDETNVASNVTRLSGNIVKAFKSHFKGKKETIIVDGKNVIRKVSVRGMISEYVRAGFLSRYNDGYKTTYSFGDVAGPEWLYQTVEKVGKTEIYRTGPGVGLGMFYRKYAEFIVRRTNKKLTLKFVQFGLEKDGPKNLRPELVIIDLVHYPNWEAYSIHLKSIFDNNREAKNPMMKEISNADFYRASNSLAAMEGKYFYSFMTGEYIGSSSYFSGDVGMHGFSQYSATCGELYIIPLTNSKFQYGKSMFIKRLLNDTELGYEDTEDLKPIKLYGYFLKQMPEGHQKYDFNLLDNFVCPVTALTKQCKAIDLPSNDDIMRMYLDLGIFKRNDIRMSSAELPDFYHQLARQLLINFRVRLWYLRRNKEGVTKSSSRKYYFVGKPLEGVPYYTYKTSSKKDTKTLTNYKKAVKEEYVDNGLITVVLMEGHVFNTNVRGAKVFLEKVCTDYEKLEDNIDIHRKMMDDIQEFLKKEDQLISINPCNMLNNRKELKMCEVLPRLKEDKTAYRHPDLPKYKKDRQLLLFFYDYETRSAKNYQSKVDQDKFRARNYDLSDVITRPGEKFEDLSTVTPYSNTVLWFNKQSEILNSLFTFDPEPQANCRKMMEWILNIAVPRIPELRKNKEGKVITGSDNLYCLLYAHYGAGFDNIITLYDMLRHIDMVKLHPNIVRVLEPKKIDQAGRPISIDFTFHVKVASGLKTITISLRDSHRITSTPVASLGSTFGLKVNKLLYPYGYYQYALEEKMDILGSAPEQKIDEPQVEECPELMEEFDNYCQKYTKQSYANKMLSYLSMKNTKAFDDDFMRVKWSKIGIDNADLEAISELKSPKDVEKYRFNSENRPSLTSSGLKMSDFTNDELVDNDKRIFTNEFILQMAKVCTKKFDKVSECDDQIVMLTDYQAKLTDDTMFDTIEFCKIYNYFDCFNVVQALCKFQQLFIDLSKVNKVVKLTNGEEVHIDLSNLAKIDIFQHRTISSIAFCVGLQAGVFNGMCKLSGNIARFYNVKIGGKVFVNHKRDIFYSLQHDKISELIGQEVTPDNLSTMLDCLTSNHGSQIDLDINSFYPAAIASMKTPLGMPKYVVNKPDCDIYGKITKMLDDGFPFKVCCSYKSKYVYDLPENCCKHDGKNEWRNGEFKNVLIDDVKMRYLIDIGEVDLRDFTFQLGTIGVAFTEWNYHAAGLLQFMYDERLVQKKLGNTGLATIYKLIMNNIYGKSILKETQTKSRYIHTDNIKSHMRKNMHKLASEVVSAGNYYEIKEYTRPCDYKIYPQFGDRVLTTSKTISGKYAWILAEVDKKNAYLAANPDFEYKSDLKSIVAFTKKFCRVVDGLTYVESYVSSTDTDSFNCPIQCLPLMKPFISTKLGDLESDYEFDKNETITDFVDYKDNDIYLGRLFNPKFNVWYDHPKKKRWIVKNMEKTAIECYYVAPKTYGCRVLMAEKKGDKYYYCTKDHVRAKGVPRSCKPSFDDIKSLYFGNPVKYFTTIKGDNSLISFIHSKGNGLGQRRTTTVKEIMPYQLNTSKYYYADGGCLAGHYKFNELPIILGRPSEVRFHLYDEDRLERFDDLKSTYQLHTMTDNQVYREGNGIRCGIFDASEPLYYIDRPCKKEQQGLYEYIEINNKMKTEHYKINVAFDGTIYVS